MSSPIPFLSEYLTFFYIFHNHTLQIWTILLSRSFCDSCSWLFFSNLEDTRNNLFSQVVNKRRWVSTLTKMKRQASYCAELDITHVMTMTSNRHVETALLVTVKRIILLWRGVTNNLSPWWVLIMWHINMWPNIPTKCPMWNRLTFPHMQQYAILAAKNFKDHYLFHSEFIHSGEKISKRKCI